MDICQIGNHLIEYRKKNNMTIKDFSSVSGVSTALLSQLERGMGNPSLNVLIAIARTMSIPVAALFEEAINLSDLVKKSNEQTIIKDSYSDEFEFQLLTTKTSKLCKDLYRIAIKPTTDSNFYPFGKSNNDEIIYMEKGSIHIFSDTGSNVILKKGDSIRLPSKLRYKIKNTSSYESYILYVTSNSKEIL
ncbi:helix-turn-helix domain-containing protein [Peptostreptococcus equinus]|uniref:Helix-turn-helix domain-containing protein n=1 Tax=Peptostreptococcus equinus TaxID=3003601 RepID=A0ABY7JQ60_9FIRM|nr:helix-turn-helix domain-containing protein [Peptostreptococcus sp. CBA3647]WAW15491.1 helix-turn-helix domain-containing protein [Peptostreptococcus sp. CBA3647]